ncbi:hypothetical protein AVEN_177756-1 [Araneus ventricosus]|uniref:Uncharacterized protein n=1 Tax=Araneus ventricosus TaxID=182803 RepID=A0A4Y2NFC5_ARAVE|nr:hypothetical protein AVEN_248187-1 [Araneus ventricosus]GBN37588.1 hypothetical protein AVEN_254713-1 [Araneus ventricosus]GBN37595.1 hypothetical protein AVEN_22259-1 [Araneus ventricosus]GBN37643.1 hypothetical protein AVEN_177756-1 [Araneus ventricosus]
MISGSIIPYLKKTLSPVVGHRRIAVVESFVEWLDPGQHRGDPTPLADITCYIFINFHPQNDCPYPGETTFLHFFSYTDLENYFLVLKKLSSSGPLPTSKAKSNYWLSISTTTTTTEIFNQLHKAYY